MIFLTPNDIAKLLKVSRSTVYDWASRNMIPSYKINGSVRFEELEILSWIANSKSTQEPDTRTISHPAPHMDVDAIIESAIASETESGYNSPKLGNQADFRVSGRRNDGTL